MSQFNEKIHVLSLGVGNILALNKSTMAVINDADLIIGAEHHLESLSSIDKTKIIDKVNFPSPFSDLIPLLHENINKKIIVCASGDALFYGVGKMLLDNLGQENIIFHPNISSMQVAFHKTGMEWANAVIHSLHGRPIESLSRCLLDNALIGVFTDQKSNPAAIAKLLVHQGYAKSEILVCEALGKSTERISAFIAEELSQCNKKFDVLNICIIKCKGANHCFHGMPGIADDCFETGKQPGKGMISKREVRLAILSLMEAYPNDTAWDVGAGCGSVSIEWALQNKNGKIYAIEHNQARMNYLNLNMNKFGVNLNAIPVPASAPEACENLPAPDVIFIGGHGGDLATMLEYCWEKLQQNGRLIVSAVMQSSVTVIEKFARQHQSFSGEFLKLQVSKTNTLTKIDALQELKPITLFKITKRLSPCQ